MTNNYYLKYVNKIIVLSSFYNTLLTFEICFPAA